MLIGAVVIVGLVVVLGLMGHKIGWSDKNDRNQVNLVDLVVCLIFVPPTCAIVAGALLAMVQQDGVELNGTMVWIGFLLGGISLVGNAIWAYHRSRANRPVLRR